MEHKVMIDELIARRRSIFPKDFIGEEVDQVVIEKMLENANLAPTHKLTQPWRFKVVRGAALERLGDFLAESYRANPKGGVFLEKKYQSTRSKVLRSSAVILLCMQRDAQERVPEWEETAAFAMAVQNLWLTATAHGVGGYWSSPPYIEQLHKFVSLAEGERCLGLFYLGNFTASGPSPKRDEWITKVQWIDQ